MFLTFTIAGKTEDLPLLKLESPNGKFVFSFNIEDYRMEKSCMFYNVDYDNKQVILKSRLGVNTAFKDNPVDTWNNNVKIVKSNISEHNETWNPVYGERKEIQDHYNELTISLDSDNKFGAGIMKVIVRAYNEGIALRYYFLNGHNGGGHLHIASELTEFVLPENTKAYFTEKAQTEYKIMPLTGWPSEAERPLTLELQNGLIACLTEAEMVNYARTKFALDTTHPNTIKCSMYSTVDYIVPFYTPWRVIMVAEKPGQLLENNYIILNLNPPCKIDNTSWIKPGKVMREITLSTEGAKKLIDFAVERNLQFILFDAGWYGSEFDINSDATTATVDPKRNPKNDLNLEEVLA
jgi:alpha-glucosidase